MPSHYKGAENEVRALNAFINLMRASDSLAARGALLLESQGLTHGQFGTMEALFHLGPLCQRALGEKLLRSGGNLTLVIEVLVSLTPKGRARIEKVFPAHVAFLTGEFSGLTSREQETLRRLCRKLGRSLGGSKGAQRSKGKGGASEA